MKEIGGYLEFEKLVSNEYHKNMVSLNIARNALLYVLKARKINKIFIPYFLCESISIMLEKNKYKYEYYFINKNFEPIFTKKLNNDEYLYIVNYYGQISNEKISEYKIKYKNIIIDNVQAFFQKNVEGIDTIYSCRKFFGVPDGAYLSTDKRLKQKFEIDKSGNRMKHLLGRYEGDASEYYSDFKNNDKSFKEVDLKYMSNLTHNILGAIDYNYVIERRNKNFKYLYEILNDINKMEIRKDITGPYCYPLYLENGMKIKKELAEKNIYIPTLWPNVLEMTNSIEKDYAENILPIPCDQRYEINDMKKIIENLPII